MPVRFSQLISSPREELRCLAAAWGDRAGGGGGEGGGVIEPEELLSSPELLGTKPQARRAAALAASLAVGRKKAAPLAEVLAALDDGGRAAPAALTEVLAAMGDGDHDYTKEEAARRWEETRRAFPTIDAILQSGGGSCAQDVVAVSG